MTRNETDGAALFFAEFLLPLRQANRRARIDYLDRRPGQTAAWAAVATRTGGLACIGHDGHGAAKLLAALGVYWQGQGEERLPVLLPHIKALRHRLVAGDADADRQSPSLPDFVYPMF